MTAKAAPPALDAPEAEHPDELAGDEVIYDLGPDTPAAGGDQ